MTIILPLSSHLNTLEPKWLRRFSDPPQIGSNFLKKLFWLGEMSGGGGEFNGTFCPLLPVPLPLGSDLLEVFPLSAVKVLKVLVR